MSDGGYSRISISLPQELLTLADQLARESDRSRSWVIAEAIRQLGEGEPRATPTGEGNRTAPNQPPGREAAALQQLPLDLGLSAEERVREAERRGRSTPGGTGKIRNQILGFARYEDYLAWHLRTGGEA